MQAYCPVSFALKLAVLCLLLGVIVGAWISATLVSASDSQSGRAPTTQVADVLAGRR